ARERVAPGDHQHHRNKKVAEDKNEERNEGVEIHRRHDVAVKERVKSAGQSTAGAGKTGGRKQGTGRENAGSARVEIPNRSRTEAHDAEAGAGKRAFKFFCWTDRGDVFH